MLLSTSNPDCASIARIEAAVLTELAMGEPRQEIAFRLVCVMLGIISEVDHDGAPVQRVADRLRSIARQLEAA